MSTFIYVVGNDGPRFDSYDEADGWARAGNVGGTYEINCLAWCSVCEDEVPADDPARGCPFCGGKWTPMGDGEWHAFEGGDRERFEQEKAEKAARERQRDQELAMLAAWNAGQPIRGVK